MQFDVRPPDVSRFVDALRRVPTDAVPYFDAEFAPGIVSAIMDKPLRGRSYELPLHDYIEFARRIGMDVCYMTVPWWLGRTPYVDENGVTRYTTGNLGSRADLDRVTPPETDAARERIETFLEAAEGTRVGFVLALPTPGSVIVSALGFQRYFMLVYDDLAFIEELVKRCEPLVFRMTERLLPYKPAAVFLSSFACYKTGMCMSREMTERFVLEPVARHARMLTTAGIPAIMHSDGDNSDIMDRWIEMGFSGFHPVEPSEHCDIYEHKKRWGDRIALCGNIDCATVLSGGTPEEVARDTLEHLGRLSPGGGYLCGSSHDVGDNVPVDNLRAMVETVARYRADSVDAVRSNRS